MNNAKVDPAASMTADEALAFADKTMDQRLREARATGNDHDYDAAMEACIDTLAAEVRRLRDQPCGCACHVAAGHADEPTVSMMLADALKKNGQLRADLAVEEQASAAKDTEIANLTANGHRIAAEALVEIKQLAADLQRMTGARETRTR